MRGAWGCGFRKRGLGIRVQKKRFGVPGLKQARPGFPGASISSSPWWGLGFPKRYLGSLDSGLGENLDSGSAWIRVQKKRVRVPGCKQAQPGRGSTPPAPPSPPRPDGAWGSGNHSGFRIIRVQKIQNYSGSENHLSFKHRQVVDQRPQRPHLFLALIGGIL